MRKTLIADIVRFYADGFRNMTWGRNLWVIIIVKLFIMFAILRVFFFPDYLNSHSNDAEKDAFVSRELIDRAIE